jgi:F-type H+-transporting ATPase subunit epsilon
MSLDLEVLVPEGAVVHARAAAVQAADASGRFGLLPGHEAFVTLLTPCVLASRDEAGHEHYVAADGGVLLLERDAVQVVTREAVAAERLEEVADAAKAMLEERRARERLARTEFSELQTALLRQLREVQGQS